MKVLLSLMAVHVFLFGLAGCASSPCEVSDKDASGHIQITGDCPKTLCGPAWGGEFLCDRMGERIQPQACQVDYGPIQNAVTVSGTGCDCDCSLVTPEGKDPQASCECQ